MSLSVILILQLFSYSALTSESEETVIEEAVIEEAVIEEAVIEEAVIEEAVIEEAVIEEAVIEEAVIEEAVIEETITEEVVIEETRVSEILTFKGQPVGSTENGLVIRKEAIFRGKSFTWNRELTQLVAEEDSVSSDAINILELSEIGSEVDMDVLELAENLRAVAYFNGHEFIEEEPPIELAQRIIDQMQSPNPHGKVEGKSGSMGKLGGSVFDFFPDFFSSALDPYIPEDPEPDEPQAEKILGETDERIVYPHLRYPYRTNIVFNNEGDASVIDGTQGSGTLIGPSTAISAAHVFWDKSNKTWEAPHRWSPGYSSQSSPSNPFGDWFECYWVTIPKGRIDTGSSLYDYAILDFNVGCDSTINGVNSDRPGEMLGWVGWYTPSEQQVVSHTAYVRAYPSSKGECGNPPESCGIQIWGDHSHAEEMVFNAPHIEHQADTSGGMSGGAMYHYTLPFCSQCRFGPYMIGIHRAAISSANRARLFDIQIKEFMKAHSSDF